jgi:hypothetical protein
MTPYLTCESAGTLLEPFLDGELAVADQVAVEAHLRWCNVCAARLADMQLIGGSLRRVGHGASQAPAEQTLAAMQSAVLTRVRAEREQAFTSQVRSLFVDMRLLWPALGATAALLACVMAASGVFAAATAEESPDSMAAMISMLANPGSDANPRTLDNSLFAPRALDASHVLDSIGDEDAVYALSAVVTREGRVSNYELLLSERASVRRREKAAEGDREAAALMAAVKRSRFSPAQSRDGGGPVAVNLVWLVARTTVKGSAAQETVRPRRSEAATPVPVPDVQKPMPVIDGDEPAVPARQSGESAAGSTAA